MKINTLLVGLASVALTVSALASGIEADVPFAFRAGDRELPAGNYSFVVNDGTDVVSVRGAGQEIRLATKTRLRGPTAALNFEGTLAFDRKGDTRTLSEVWIPMEEGYQVGVTDGADAHVLVHVVTRATEKMSPKQIFEQTCQVCHGPEGRGNATADKFFNKALPRLNSTFVQSKSDAELREVITLGRGAMDPVRQQQPNGVRHALPAHAVDPLIAYLRTLASKT